MGEAINGGGVAGACKLLLGALANRGNLGGCSRGLLGLGWGRWARIWRPWGPRFGPASAACRREVRELVGVKDAEEVGVLGLVGQR